MMVTKEITKKWLGGGTIPYTTQIPYGLLVKKFDIGRYFLDQFPLSLFPLNSIERHDAVHYGIVLNGREVTKVDVRDSSV